MKTKEFKGIASQHTAKDNNLILNIIEHSCIPLNSWFETHSRLKKRSGGKFRRISSYLYSSLITAFLSRTAWHGFLESCIGFSTNVIPTG